VKVPAWADTALALFFLVIGGSVALVWAALLGYGITTGKWEAMGDFVWGGLWLPFAPLIGWRMLRRSQDSN